MKVYADPSFIVSLYYLDVHSAEAERRFRQSSPTVVLTSLAELEVVNALQLRVFRKEASASQIRTAKGQFANDIRAGVFATAAVPAEAYELAQNISTKRSATLGTRTVDILHVACASLHGVEGFWTFDARQAELAKAEGLRVR